MQGEWNEDLNQRRSQLFYEAQRLKKQGRGQKQGVFGASLVQVKEQSQPKAVADYNDIMILINDETNMPP